MNWQPQQEPLRQLARYLRDSLNGANLPARAEAEQVMSFPFFLVLLSFFSTAVAAHTLPQDGN